MASSNGSKEPLRAEERERDAVHEVLLEDGRRRRGRLFPECSSFRRMGYELRIRLWMATMGLLLLTLCAALLYAWKLDAVSFAGLLLGVGVAWLLLSEHALSRIVVPLQTLANVIAAIRTEDYSFRVRGAHRGDAAGDLALEINLLSASLQAQKREVTEARALVDRVLSTLEAPVLAFSEDGRLAMLNQAALAALSLRSGDLGRSAEDLAIDDLLRAEDQSLMTDMPRALPGRWMLRRSAFRLQGRRHVLVMLTEIGYALREEERQAWQRLIRVLGHEINNSLAPIKSIAGSLQQRLGGDDMHERETQLRKGLGIIEARADSLNRFLQSYRTLSALPPVQCTPVSLLPFLQRLAALEQRVPVLVVMECDAVAEMDPVLMEQALINLLKNAAEATLEVSASQPSIEVPPVEIHCECREGQFALRLRDYGFGIANEDNLFVPFYTTKPEGSGIGLVLAQRIAESHGGTLRLKNAEGGRGCIAHLSLPARTSVAAR